MLTLGNPMSIELMAPKSTWILNESLNGYEGERGPSLSTQVIEGRTFQLVHSLEQNSLEEIPQARVKVRLLEDGYICWFELEEILVKSTQIKPLKTTSFSKKEIELKVPAVLSWVERAAAKKNQYLWGGTIGPDFDCSGLVQSAFASEGIWLPRDAYQQERFCRKLEVESNDFHFLRAGDLIFFGTPQRCFHVALYKGQGLYWHSSGAEHGHNGIACDGLPESYEDPVACYYRSQLRGAGRVEQCFDSKAI